MNVMGQELTTNGDCLDWPGYVHTGGYGKLGHEYAHRAAYSEHVASIPKGLNVLHTCDNPLCCNPEHLFLGTQKDNLKDCVDKGRHNHWNSRKTHCSHGHEYTAENTHTDERGYRYCLTCEPHRDEVK